MTTPEEIAKSLIDTVSRQMDRYAWEDLQNAIATALTAYGAECAARERAEKHELQRHLGIQKSRRMTEQEAHAALRQAAAYFVQKWHDGTVWGSDELRHFAHQFEQALRSLP